MSKLETNVLYYHCLQSIFERPIKLTAKNPFICTAPFAMVAKRLKIFLKFAQVIKISVNADNLVLLSKVLKPQQTFFLTKTI